MNTNLRAEFIGRQARADLSEGMGKVIGVTSRGLFILTPANHVLFITHETFRSPHSINIPGGQSFINKALQNEPAALSADTVRLVQSKVEIDLSSAVVWLGSQPGKVSGSWLSCRERAAAVAARLITVRQNHGFSEYLAAWVTHSTLPGGNGLADHFTSALANAQTGDFDGVVACLARFSGFGRGLTPSGDDCIAGFLLAVNRYGGQLLSLDQIQAANEALVSNAMRTTTALSANIIRSAATGESDERLISLVDGVFTGQPPVEQCFQAALAYGSSSGIDALTGMALIIELANSLE